MLRGILPDGLAGLVLLVGASAVLLTSRPSIADSRDSAQDPWNAPSRQLRKKNPIPADKGSILTGKKIFAAHCQTCHGTTGQGDGRSAYLLSRKPADLTSTQVLRQPDGALFWKIGEGRRPMPTFASELPEEARWNVINYQRSLAQRPTTRP